MVCCSVPQHGCLACLTWPSWLEAVPRRPRPAQLTSTRAAIVCRCGCLRARLDSVFVFLSSQVAPFITAVGWRTAAAAAAAEEKGTPGMTDSLTAGSGLQHGLIQPDTQRRRPATDHVFVVGINGVLKGSSSGGVREPTRLTGGGGGGGVKGV